ncbi:acyl-CoA-binding domain-containing protein 4 isoform X2 [Cynocephalus volans]|uniref:acyl-CoA-binding domain-containing protein 4 isoform X2 n=1 Tax=Cynocephalus volans TaxID=110931 RepID=UPI002FCB8F6D
MGTENESPEPDCQKQFQAAVSVIHNLPKNGSYRPSYEEMLRFYSYYKQATMGPCLVPRPGFWDPIGRYKWDAWNSLGKMSREEAMTAYITEMKLVAQKVIDTVPLGEVAEDMFDYFEPLYRVIPDMPRPPEAFLRRVTGWKGQVLNGDVRAVPEPPSLPKEPAPPSPASLLSITLPNPSPESQPPRDLDSEVFCDSLEQLESELQVWTEQSGAPRGESDTRNSPVSSREKDDKMRLREVTDLPKVKQLKSGSVGIQTPAAHYSATWMDFPRVTLEGLGGSLLGPQELDTWLVGTVRALQESMRDVQGRLQSLENMSQPPKQGPQPSARPWPLRLSGPTLLFFFLWPFFVQWLFRQFRTQKRLRSWAS